MSSKGSKRARLQYVTNGTFFDALSAAAMTAVGAFETKSNNLAAIPGLNDNANAALRIAAEFESTAAGTGSTQYVTTSRPCRSGGAEGVGA